MLDSVGVHMDLESAAADCRCRAEISSEEKQYDGDEEGKHIFHVLAVDDSLIDRKLLERLLTVSSYQVTCVDSGDKALEYLGLLRNIREDEIKISPPLSPTISCDIDEPSSKSSSPQEIISTISCHQPSSKPSSPQQVSKVNLIMTDYSMPGISGYDLLKRIKDSSWKDVPVVVMSSENVPSRINMCLEGGAEEFLLKPVKLSDLSKLQSHILKNAVGHNPNCLDRPKTTIEEHLTIGNDEKGTTNDGDVENDKNCSNANKRKATLKTPPDLTDRRPRVQELSVS